MSKGRRGRGTNKITGFDLFMRGRVAALRAARACPPMTPEARQRDEQLFTGSGGRLTGPAGGVASSFAPPRSPAGGSGVGPPAGGGGALVPRFDGRDASGSDLREWLRIHGLDPAVLPENRPMSPAEQKRERRSGPGAAITFERYITDRKRRQREHQRAEQAAGDFDARTAEPAAVAERLRSLGIDLNNPPPDGYAPEITLRPAGGKPLEPPFQSPFPASRERDAARRARTAEVNAQQAGKPFDVSGLDGEAFQALLRARGIQNPTSWGPAVRTPSRR